MNEVLIENEDLSNYSKKTLEICDEFILDELENEYQQVAVGRRQRRRHIQENKASNSIELKRVKTKDKDDLVEISDDEPLNEVNEVKEQSVFNKINNLKSRIVMHEEHDEISTELTLVFSDKSKIDKSNLVTAINGEGDYEMSKDKIFDDVFAFKLPCPDKSLINATNENFSLNSGRSESRVDPVATLVLQTPNFRKGECQICMNSIEEDFIVG